MPSELDAGTLKNLGNPGNPEGSKLACAGHVPFRGAAIPASEENHSRKTDGRARLSEVLRKLCVATCSSFVISLGMTSTARADESTDRARAAELYASGSRLLASGNYAAAEPYFRESLVHLRGRGTLLNLAICHENMGRFALSHQEFQEVLASSMTAGDAARADAAREHLAWLAPQLSWLLLAANGRSTSELSVSLDGARLADWAQRVPLNPGRHVLEVSAVSKQAYRRELHVEPGARREFHVSLPELLALPTAARTTSVSVPTTPAVPQRVHTASEWTPIYIAGSATLVFAAGAVVSAFEYYNRYDSYEASRTAPESVSDDELKARHASARTMAWVNGAAIVGTGIGLGVTSYFVYRKYARPKPSTAVRVTPWFAPSGAGLFANAAF